jgi:hypothetical protein
MSEENATLEAELGDMEHQLRYYLHHHIFELTHEFEDIGKVFSKYTFQLSSYIHEYVPNYGLEFRV